MGIGPTQSAWKADVLPLNYTRIHPAVSALQVVSPADFYYYTGHFLVCQHIKLYFFANIYAIKSHTKLHIYDISTNLSAINIKYCIGFRFAASGFTDTSRI